MKKISISLFSLFLGLQSVHAAPIINVGALNEYIQPEKSTIAKRIFNTGDKTAFVRITINEIIYDDSGKSIETPLDTESLINGKGRGLISTPPRMIIPAGGVQTNRIIFTGTKEKERYYRVRYVPVVPDAGNEFGLSNDDAKKYEKDINAGVTMLTGFGTIFTVFPEQVKFNTKITGNQNSLQIKNNGNGSIIISDLKSCDIKTKKCDSPSTLQLRPGRQLVRDALSTKFWQYVLIEGSTNKSLNTKKAS